MTNSLKRLGDEDTPVPIMTSSPLTALRLGLLQLHALVTSVSMSLFEMITAAQGNVEAQPVDLAEARRLLRRGYSGAVSLREGPEASMKCSSSLLPYQREREEIGTELRDQKD